MRCMGVPSGRRSALFALTSFLEFFGGGVRTSLPHDVRDHESSVARRVVPPHVCGLDGPVSSVVVLPCRLSTTLHKNGVRGHLRYRSESHFGPVKLDCESPPTFIDVIDELLTSVVATNGPPGGQLVVPSVDDRAL